MFSLAWSSGRIGNLSPARIVQIQAGGCLTENVGARPGLLSGLAFPRVLRPLPAGGNSGRPPGFMPRPAPRRGGGHPRPLREVRA